MKETDKIVLRKLAETVAKLAGMEENKEKAKAWKAHNDLQAGSRAMVLCDPENGWNEIIPSHLLQCEDSLARFWEFALRREIHSAQVLKDDKVIDDTIYVTNYHTNTGWGLTSHHMVSGENGSYKAEAVLDDYSKMAMMHYPEVKMDYETIERVTEIAHDVFDGILKVGYKANWWWSLGLSNVAIDLRGLENFMLDMYDYPDELHALMNFLCEGTLQMLDYLEKNRLLTQNIGNTYVGSGGFGFTDCLPKAEGEIRLKDMWGFTESQETVSVSPEMFEEFVFPYQLKIAKKFGLNCYGCCEPLDARWNIIKQIPNLRRVSVSHWADCEKMAGYLRNEYIFSLKPSPSYLATPQINEDAAREELRTKIWFARSEGCHLEIIMKDNHTLGNNPHNASRWVEIAREELAR